MADLSDITLGGPNVALGGRHETLCVRFVVQFDSAEIAHADPFGCEIALYERRNPTNSELQPSKGWLQTSRHSSLLDAEHIAVEVRFARMAAVEGTSMSARVRLWRKPETAELWAAAVSEPSAPMAAPIGH